ncbi:GNAT family N-acetyltransferase [Paractinoplanes lichenicola]|uniref:ornithine decarboxylase n=1 Tax=Paractinoplanes lichenicola TaxID=2802976 RepID=A0ABS1W502_9ACTN|nr:GNAT family N-acetyltransferase [Actinoplanes lichenicola]MBL7261633.1 GNAT family N-acetyltransferase [Actinoplanes lichenicola]
MIPEHVRAALAEAGDDRIVYDLTGIENQLDTLRAELPGVHVRFAMKACPVDEVLACLADRGAGFDAAGPGEIRSALRTGVAPTAVHYGNTVKSDADIAAAYRLGITTFATDCVEDVRAIAAEAPGARVFCRVPTDGAGALWGLTGKFGSEDPVAVLAEARRLGLTPAGLSLHVGSQQLTVRAWAVAFDLLAALLPRLAEQGIALDHVNLGGGLPAAGYLAPDGTPLHPPTAAVFAAIREGMRRLAGYGLDYVVEPGRYLVADHGTVRARVTRLTVRKSPWLYLSCGRFNGLYEGDKVRYRLEFPGHEGGPLMPATVAGPSCDSDDTLGGGPVPVPAGLTSGDPVWIHAAGAYATSYTTMGFNGFDPLACHAVRAERFRPIAEADWDAVAELEAAAYSSHGLSEGPAALRSRAANSTSFVLDTGERVGGYLIALPYPRFRFPDLSRPERSVFGSTNLHLHDVVVDEKLRGRGWGRRMLRRLKAIAEAQAYERISLVAVDGLAPYWASHGFAPHPGLTPPDGYGPGAVYMSRSL